MGVIACAETADAEMVRGSELVVVMPEEREEILELRMRPFERTQVGYSIAARQEVHANSVTQASRSEDLSRARYWRLDHRPRVSLACRVPMTKIGGQWAAVPLNVSGEEEPLAVSVDGEAGGAAKLVLPVNIRRIVKSIILAEPAAAIVFVGFAMPIVSAGFSDDVEEATGGAAKLGGEAIGHDLKLLNGFDRHG